MRFTWQDALPLVESVPDKQLVVWGYHDPPGMAEYAQQHNLPLYRMEDGFLRSVGLGSHHAAPYSLILDDRALYFDARQPSRLELMLNQLTLTSADTLWQDAETLRQQLISLAISKYNYKNAASSPSALEVYGAKERKRVLVIGQVESDASIKYGCPNLCTNEALLALALAENPDAQVIYKPHPDVTTGKQPSLSAPEKYSDQALMLQGEWPLAKALDTVNHVYTLTSLAGMEALLRQTIKVTVVGQPFYSGWGLTDDREPLARRQATLSLQALIAGVYLLYPKYNDPETGESLTAIQVVERLHQAIQ
jgi:capsular polysaccharide export protein